MFDGGVAVMDGEANEVVVREFNRGLIVWFAAGLGFGVVIVPGLVWKAGRVAEIVTPRQSGAWLGACLGVAAHSFILELTLPLLLPSGMTPPVRFVFLTFGYLSIILFFAIRNRKQNVIDPGPPYHILGLRNSAEFGSWMLKLELPKGESPPIGTVPRDGPAYSVGKVGKLVSATHNKNSIISLGLISCVNMTSIVISLTSSRAAWYFSVVQIPLTVLIFMGFDHFTCKTIDTKLYEVNMEPTMLRRNLYWVLRRTRLTLLYSLWLVRRDPYLSLMPTSWISLYPHCTLHFRRTVKLLLLITSSCDTDDPNWLPADITLLVFSYLASSDKGQRHTKNCQKILI
eukprot:TRINITY_DN6766_c1_g1_i1.p1 TRINITY_DN6766_c1_g1~~TRINITY_DN6766_c1_g1_i1.p1  ORF type:complete len:375 (+),score=30.26 TRINITY_DN6766_c1_g1_i1:98-1126(+)